MQVVFARIRFMFLAWFVLISQVTAGPYNQNDVICNGSKEGVSPILRCREEGGVSCLVFGVTMLLDRSR